MRFLTAFLTIISFSSFAQTIEISTKPTQFLFKDANLSVGLKRNNITYGLFYSFRPSTKSNGRIEPIGHGLIFGDYERQRMFNELYTGNTIGLFVKYWFKNSFFLQTDLFYRNWQFENKFAEFNNVETYSFSGIRTENIDVYGLKILVGKRLLVFQKLKKASPFIDFYVGFGLRKSISVYQTTNGTVEGINYADKIENKEDFMPSPQIGFLIGLTNKNGL